MSENPANQGVARPGPAEEAEQPQAPVPRKAPSLPVRFEDPIEKSSERIVETRPVFYREGQQRQSSAGTSGRYQPFYEDVVEDEDELGEGRPSSSSLLGERERERESPTPISVRERRGGDDEEFVEVTRGVRGWSGDSYEGPIRVRERVRGWSGDSYEGPIRVRERVQGWSGDSYNGPVRARERVRAGSGDTDELDARIRHALQSSYEAGKPRDRSYPPSHYVQSDYQPRRRARTRERGGNYYDDDDEIDTRIPAHHRSRERRRGSSYYDEDDDLDIRVRRGPAAPTPIFYPASSYYDDDDELDVRVRRGNVSPSPVVYPQNPFRPPPRPYYEGSNSYLVPTTGHTHSRIRSPLLPAPVIINNRIHNDHEDDDYIVFRDTPRSRSLSRPQRRHRSLSPPLESVVEPIIINTRVYNDYEDAPILSKSRSRSRPSGPGHGHGDLPAPVIINNTRIYNDYEHDDYLSIAPNRRSPEVDLDAVTEAYSFSLSRHTKNSDGARSISGSISDISEQSEPQEEEPLKKASSSGRTQNILRSQYVGDGLVGGRHAVKLIVTPESDPIRRKSVSPIFRWVHFEDMNMDLEQFQSNALNISRLTDAERGAISKLLGRAKKKYDKPLQTSRNMKVKFMVPSFLQDNISGEMRPKVSRARTISWLCVPYFCLDRYATPANLKPSSHPMRTLLQARYSLVQKKRDMEQAVCHLSGTPVEHCFYIAQIWLLILDDSLIISCAQSPISSLQGESISIVPNPTESPMTLSQNILVYTKNTLLWSLPVDECQDWFGFVSHFWEYWPRPFQITYHEKVITAEDWPKVFVIAKKYGIRLSIDFRLNMKEPAKGILLEDPISEESSTKDTTDATPDNSDVKTFSRPSLRVKDHRRSKPDASPHGNKEGFHVFTWSNPSDGSPNTSPTPPAVNIGQDSPDVEGSKLEEDQKEIDDFLRLKTNLNDRLAYRSCPFSKRIELYKFLAKERKELTPGDGIEVTDQNRRVRYETKVDILNAADSIIQFFLPSDSEIITAQKYWGALYRLWEPVGPDVTNAAEPPPHITLIMRDRDSNDLVDWLQLINRSITPFRVLLSQVPDTERANIQIPEELERAWLHLLLSFAFLAKDMQVFDEQMVICNNLLELGMKKVIQSMSDVRLSNYAVFPPSEFASLVTFQLLQDVNESALDISETYLEYLKSLESEIESNPLDRGHQNRIVSLKQEISVISETLLHQQRILSQAQVGFGYSRVLTQADFEPHSREASGQSRSRLPAYYGSREAPHKSPGYVDNDPLPRPVQTLPGNEAAGPNIGPSGVQGLLLQDGLAVVEKRIREFREMRDRASDLGDWNIQKIDSNKDRQEAAIYAFTIVTIIFLPLSTVASILGMNTLDVRNMTVNQWVFWATALPLMVLIITLCLIWAGELKNVWEGFAKLWRRDGSKGYKVLDDQFERRDRDRYDEMLVRERSRERSGPRRRHALYGASKESYV